MACERICGNVNNFNKTREIIQHACYVLFSTILTVHKKTKTVWDPLFLNTVFGYLNDSLLFFFVMVVHESLVCSEQLN